MKLTNALLVVMVLSIFSLAKATEADNLHLAINANTNHIALDTFPNWFNLDFKSDNVMGVSTERTYKELLKGKKGQKVVVAVLDSGIDIDHEDLKDIIWVNKDEIPNNGKDDDNNGYVDDVNGWNFIGGSNGSHIHHDALEVTRLYAYYQKKEKEGTLTNKEAEYFKAVKKEYNEQSADVNSKYSYYKVLLDEVKGHATAIRKEIGKDEFTYEDIKDIKTDDADLQAAIAFAGVWSGRGYELPYLEAGLEGNVKSLESRVKYYYNLDFDPRADIVDNEKDYYNSNERYYGNGDVVGPDPFHGTHVAGIIAAIRNNDLGIDGVADNVEIMVVRVVPDGDERDKDVANAIRYAVDNGASIINMSFGKSFSWDKDIVDQAVRYATKNDVLLVHAAGNDAKNTDIEDNFPTDTYQKRRLFRSKQSNTWLEVGALSWKEDEVAGFSNYGKDGVDLFAPGVQINSTVPYDEGDEKKYGEASGTSMAAPVVAGVAAVLRSYYPTLSAKQVKEILMETTVKPSEKYNLPGGEKGENTSLDELCVTGGIVNLFEAVKKAENTRGKRKKKTVKP